MTTERIIAVFDEADWRPACAGITTTRHREAARAVVGGPAGVGLIYSRRDGYHKLPGGGIEPGETPVEALIREVREESGAQIAAVEPLGAVIEHRRSGGLTQITHCFAAQAVSVGAPELTQREAAADFVPLWLPLDDAIATLNGDDDGDGSGDLFRRFIRRRELSILRFYQDWLSTRGEKGE